MVVDDGLHSLGAMANTLLMGLRTLAPGGWIVLEDVGNRVLPGLAIVDRLLRTSSTSRGGGGRGGGDASPARLPVEAWLVPIRTTARGTSMYAYVVHDTRPCASAAPRERAPDEETAAQERSVVEDVPVWRRWMARWRTARAARHAASRRGHVDVVMDVVPTAVTARL